MQPRKSLLYGAIVFTITREIRGCSQTIRGYDLECPGLTSHLVPGPPSGSSYQTPGTGWDQSAQQRGGHWEQWAQLGILGVKTDLSSVPQQSGNESGDYLRDREKKLQLHNLNKDTLAHIPARILAHVHTRALSERESFVARSG